MPLRVIERDDLKAFAQALIRSEPQVLGAVRKDDGFVFAPLRSADELELNYTSTLLPPKKVLFPPRETLFRFRVGSDVQGEAVLDNTPRLVLGVHPCDLRGIWALDQTLLEDDADTPYAQRRAATTIVGMDCKPDQYCFCTSVGSHVPENGTYDLFLTETSRGYVAEIGSDKGKALLERHARTREATGADIAALQAARAEKVRAVTANLGADVHTLPLLLEGAWKSPVWEELGAKCLSCGTCNLVCPTCYCFDAADQMQLNLTDGERVRRWDGCVLRDFATVAGGHNFRKEAASRVRHRYYRKFQYLMTKYGKAFCTGCGRCSRSCLVHINPPETISALVANGGGQGV